MLTNNKKKIFEMNPFFLEIIQSLRDDYINFSPEMQRKSLYFQSFLHIPDKIEKSGLSLTEIKAIKEKKFTKKIKSFSIECPICLMSFEKSQSVKILDCKHCFHSKCLDLWLEKQRTCPYCKLSINTR